MARPTPRPLPPDQDRLYRLPEVEQISGWRRSTIYRAIADGRFPRQIRIGSTAAWRKRDIDRWLAAVAGNDDPAPVEQEARRG